MAKAFFNRDLEDGQLPEGHCAAGQTIPERIEDITIDCSVPVAPPPIMEVNVLPPPPTPVIDGCFLPVVTVSPDTTRQVPDSQYRLIYPANIKTSVYPSGDKNDNCHPAINISFQAFAPVIEVDDSIAYVTASASAGTPGSADAAPETSFMFPNIDAKPPDEDELLFMSEIMDATHGINDLMLPVDAPAPEPVKAVPVVVDAGTELDAVQDTSTTITPLFFDSSSTTNNYYVSVANHVFSMTVNLAQELTMTLTETFLPFRTQLKYAIKLAGKLVSSIKLSFNLGHVTVIPTSMSAAVAPVSSGVPELSMRTDMALSDEAVLRSNATGFVNTVPKERPIVTVLRNSYVYKVRAPESFVPDVTTFGMPNLFDPAWISWLSWVVALRMGPYTDDRAKAAVRVSTDKLVTLYSLVRRLSSLLGRVLPGADKDELRALQDELARESLDLEKWRDKPKYIVPPSEDDIMRIMEKLRDSNRVLEMAKQGML